MKKAIFIILLCFTYLAFLNAQVVKKKYCFGTIFFDEQLCLPIRVIEVIKPHTIHVKRHGHFYNDKDFPCADVKNYEGSGFDKGHMIPAEDANYSDSTMNSCFVVTNLTPQVSSFNRGIWLKLETYCRKSLTDNDSLIVESGILMKDISKKGKLNIPTWFYKRITYYPSHKVECFLLKNEGSKLPIDSFRVDYFPK